MRKERKHYSSDEKVAILRRHLLDKVPVSDLCEELGLRPTVFYRWQKEFFENGAAAFQSKQRIAFAVPRTESSPHSDPRLRVGEVQSRTGFARNRRAVRHSFVLRLPSECHESSCSFPPRSPCSTCGKISGTPVSCRCRGTRIFVADPQRLR
jgi:transposase-like protein